MTKRKRVEAWAVFYDDPRLEPFEAIVITGKKTSHPGGGRIVHLTERDPAAEALKNATLCYFKQGAPDWGPHKTKWWKAVARYQKSRKK